MGMVRRLGHGANGSDIAEICSNERLGSKSSVARFLDEPRLAARFGFPGIVTIDDVGCTDDAALYIVMESLEGDPGAAL